jgi:hypothetical protein
MSLASILCVVLAVCIVMPLLAAAGLHRGASLLLNTAAMGLRGRDYAWERTALGAGFVPAGERWGGRWYSRVEGGLHATLGPCARVPTADPTPCRLTIQGLPLGLEVVPAWRARAEGIPQLRTGDPALEDVVWLTGEPERVLALLDPRCRTIVATLHRTADLEIVRGQLTVLLPESIRAEQGSERVRLGLELAERAVSHARETRHRLGMSRGLCFRSLLLVDLGRTAEGLQDGVASVAIARELGDADDEVACQVTAIRAAWAAGEPERVRTFLNEVMPVVEKHDAEGFLPLLHAWWARLAAYDGDTDAARTWLALADHSPAVRWPYQECRLDLTLARVYLALGDRIEATRRAENAVRRADAAGFRFYSLRGHCLAAMISEDEATVARHRRVADALARSLASNLPREDAERFLAQDWLVEGVGRRPTRIERVVEREETPRPLRDGRL